MWVAISIQIRDWEFPSSNKMLNDTIERYRESDSQVIPNAGQLLNLPWRKLVEEDFLLPKTLLGLLTLSAFPLPE